MNFNKLFLRWIAGFGLAMMFSVSGWGNAYTDTLNAFSSCGVTSPGSTKVIELNSSTGYSAHTLTGIVDENNGPYDVFMIKITQDSNVSYSISNTGNNDLRADVNNTCNAVSGTTILPGGVKTGTIQIAASVASPYYLYLYLESIENNQDTTYTVQVDVAGGGGVTPPISSSYANVDVVDNYSGSGGTYQSWVTTKTSAKPGITLNAVYLGNNSANPVPQAYLPSGNAQQAASMTLLFKLADMSGGATCANAPIVNLNTTLGGTTPVVAIINPGETTKPSNVFVMGYANTGSTIPLAKKDVRIKYKAVDFNSLINDSGIQCAQKSSTGGVVEGIPSCLIAQPNDTSANQNKAIQNYTTIFGATAYANCYTSNGQPCAASNGGIGAAPYDTIYGCFECSIGAMPYSCSKDNFAIRPEKLDINSTNYDYPNLLRSAQEYNTTIKGLNFSSGINSSDYNVTNANTVLTIATKMYDRNNIERNSTTNPAMYGISSFAASGFDMANGLSVKSGVLGNQVAGLSFNDVGKINLSIQDRQWAAVDINNANDPTPRDCTANGTYVCGDKNVTFIPERFDFNELNITNNNGNPGSFTYIANEVGQMAGRIQTKIRALNKDGNVTKNFGLSPLWENPITVIPVVSKSTYLYPDANETNITTLAIGFGTGTDANGTKTIAWNETNTSKYLRYNFRRDVNLPQNAFDVNGSDLNISMTSHYVDGIKVADINGSRLGTVSPGAGSSKFVYGRIIPRDIRVFGSVPFSANGWYEVFGTTSIGTTSLAVSKNDSQWYTNKLHNDANDGDANVTRIQTNGAGASTTPTLINGAALSGVESYLTPTPILFAVNNGYKAHILTMPWLWYGVNALSYVDPATGNLESACLTHPCFNINVGPAVGATGSAKSTNTATKASKKSDSSGWRSTTDYAPAVR